MRTIIVLPMSKAGNGTASPRRAQPKPHKVPSEVLLGQQRELVITHNGREYRLRITQNGKLILTA
jgi:hemin uptake protein HemP